MTSTADNVLRLEGALTMRTAPALLESGRQRAAEGGLLVDFSAVTEADSAALALVLDWLRAARGAGHDLLLHALPAGLASLAALYDIDGLLPLSGGASR
ncbi:MAG: STAS domain-containing protein [Betaproteobacteria bacterium]|nr:MAG: STAS domain-containing protein [Betaproteobacteria bacterium]